MARAPALLALWLAPTLALAQTANTVTANETSDSLDDEIIDISECNGANASNLTFTYRFGTLPTGFSTIEVRLSDTSSCPTVSENSAAKTATIQGGFTAATGTTTSRSAQGLVQLLALTCGDGTLRTLNVCAVPLGATTGSVISGTLRVDGETPESPTNVGVTPGDGALEVSWTASSSARRYRVDAVPVAGGDTRSSPSEGITGTSHRLGGLANGVEYSVTVVGLSEGGNPSTPSGAVTGTPVEVNDFWRLYQNADGQEEGGCGAGGAGLLALLGLVPLALRRRRAGPALLGALLLAAAGPARAESPRGGSFEFKILSYRPDVDSEFGGGARPFEDAFGGGKKLMFRVEFARSLVKDYGTLDLGLAVGFWQARGTGRLPDGGRSADETSFRIVPTSVFLTYRLDQLANRGIVPLAPYAKVGFERFNWWITKGSGGTANAAGRSGSGATNGFSYGGGLALLLDAIDPRLAIEMDRDTGINHTYLYAEAMRFLVNDFGSDSSFNLSSDGVVFGGGLLFVF